MAEGEGVTWQWLAVVDVVVQGSSQCCLAHGGCSRCETVVMKGGDGDGDGGGGKRGFVFIFGYGFCLVMSSSKDRLRLVRPVFCWSLNFQNHERLKTGPQLQSLMVLGISSLGQSWSSPVSVFFQSWDCTSKHYSPPSPPSFALCNRQSFDTTWRVEVCSQGG